MSCYENDLKKKKLVLVIPDLPPSWNQFLNRRLKDRLHLQLSHKKSFGWWAKIQLLEMEKSKMGIPFINKPFRISLTFTVPHGLFDTNNLCEKYIIDLFNASSENCIRPIYADDRVGNNPQVIKNAEVRKGIRQTIIIIEEI